MKFTKIVIALSMLASTIVLANPPGSNTENGNHCNENCGHHNGGNGNGGGAEGNGGNATGGNASAVGIGTAIAGASSSASSGSTASISNAVNMSTGASSNSGSTQTMESGNYRSLSLSGGSVGSPDSGTCVAHASGLFGLFTVPLTMKACIAERQALMLWNFGLKDAAVSRLCALEEIQATGICPPIEKKEEIR